jgi:hypothetical protein
MSKTEKVLSELLSHETGPNAWGHEGDLSPGFPEIKKLAALLARDASEGRLQEFLQKHPRFLMALFGFADSSTLAFVTKPNIGLGHIADFMVVAFGQGGFGFHLVEIERANVPLFTKKGTPAREYQTALGQVDDWRQWIEPNFRTFANDMLAKAKGLPKWPKRASNGSFVSSSLAASTRLGTDSEATICRVRTSP